MAYKFNPFTGKLDISSTSTGGTGDVVGPSSSTDNAIVRFDSTTGKLIQNSIATLSDTGVITIQEGASAINPFVFLSSGSSNILQIQNTGTDADPAGGIAFYRAGSTAGNFFSTAYPGLYVQGQTRLDFATSTLGSEMFISGTGTLSMNNSYTLASGTDRVLNLTPTFNQSGSAAYSVITVNATETATGSGTKKLMDLQVGSATRFSVANTGAVIIKEVSGTAITGLNFQDSAGNSIVKIQNVNTDAAANGYIEVFRSGTSSGTMQATAANGLFFGCPAGANIDMGPGGTTALRAYATGTTISIGSSPAAPSTSNSLYVQQNIGAGVNTITARLHIAAGTATASTAPLKFTAGTVLTTAEAGTMEFTNSETGLTFTAVATRRQIVLDTATQTLTNKRITKRVGTTTSSATPTINTDNVDIYTLTAQAVDITSFTTNLSGTPTDGQTLWIAITGTAARAITWGTSFEASTVALPTTTVTTNRLDVGFVWNAATSKWRCVAQA